MLTSGLHICKCAHRCITHTHTKKTLTEAVPTVTPIPTFSIIFLLTTINLTVLWPLVSEKNGERKAGLLPSQEKDKEKNRIL